MFLELVLLKTQASTAHKKGRGVMYALIPRSIPPRILQKLKERGCEVEGEYSSDLYLKLPKGWRFTETTSGKTLYNKNNKPVLQILYRDTARFQIAS